MAGKRGHGEGSFYKEPNGRWHGQLRLPNGKRKSFYGKTRREVQEKLAQLQREVEAGMHGTTDGSQSFAQFAKGWLDHHQHRLRSKTFDNYESIFRIHLDKLGDIPLDKLKPTDIQDHYTRKLQKLAPTTVQHIHAFVHVVLDSAVRLGVIPRNYADFVDAPGLKPKEMQPLSDEQARKMLAAVRGDPHEAIFVLALATGMRLGELLGLRWQDIDWQRARVKVANTQRIIKGKFIYEPPKSRSSQRTLPLPPYAIDALTRRYQQQIADQNVMGEAWQNDRDLVFTSPIGAPIRSDWLIRRFHALLVAVGLPKTTRIHDLRHTFATLLIERGVPIRVVSELLGHSSIGITLQTYGHVTPRMRDAAMEHIVDIMRLPDSINIIESEGE